jgi:hypothetical protein
MSSGSAVSASTTPTLGPSDAFAGKTASSRRWVEPGVAAAALAAELPLLLAGAAERLPVAQLVAAHIVIVAGLAAWTWLRARNGSDTGAALLTLVATAAAGVFGAFGALVAHLLGHNRGDAKLLDAWYERIALAAETDPVNKLCEEVAIGRSIDLSSPAPRSFDKVIAEGTLEERQTALGLIARQFHLEYVPALKAALLSHEPVVRVQAAAVAARVRGDLKRSVRETLAKIEMLSEPDEVLAAATRLAAAAQSGLLDETDRIRAEAGARQLSRRVGTDLRQHAARGHARDAIEAELIRSGRFDSLRVARRTAALGRGNHYRVRRLAPSRAGRSATDEVPS